jgi:hypothetical protein
MHACRGHGLSRPGPCRPRPGPGCLRRGHNCLSWGPCHPRCCSGRPRRGPGCPCRAHSAVTATHVALDIATAAAGLDHRSFRFLFWVSQSTTAVTDSLALVCFTGLRSWLIHTPLTWSIADPGCTSSNPSHWTFPPLPPDHRSIRFQFWLSQSITAIADSLAVVCSSGLRSRLVHTPLTLSITEGAPAPTLTPSIALRQHPCAHCCHYSPGHPSCRAGHLKIKKLYRLFTGTCFLCLNIITSDPSNSQTSPPALGALLRQMQRRLPHTFTHNGTSRKAALTVQQTTRSLLLCGGPYIHHLKD